MNGIENEIINGHLIIDGNSILNRTFYAIMARMTGKSNQPTNAVYGFLSIYFMVLEKFKPQYVTVTFDLKAPTFRHKMYEEYKGQRKPMPEDLKLQLPIIKDVLRAMNVHILELEGYEADDIIGTIAKDNEDRKIFTYILTGDRDSFQLISDNTNIIMPHSKSGKTTYEIIDKEVLFEKYQIVPGEVIEVKALMGDASDNIPGVPGIGEKTGYSLIHKYHNIDYIYDNFDTVELKPKQRENMQNGKESAYMSRELATIFREVPVVYNIEECKVEDPNLEELLPLFEELRFTKFAKKYDFSEVEQAKEPSFVIDDNSTVIIVENIQQIEQVFSQDVYFYLDIENNNFILYNKETNTTYIVKKYSEHIDILRAFATNKVNKYGYKIKDALNVFIRECDVSSYDLKGFIYDIDLAYYLVSYNNKSAKLDEIARELLGIELIDENTEKKQISFFDIEEVDTLSKAKEKEYIRIVKAISHLSNITKEMLEKEDALKVFNDIEMPLTLVLADMESNGIYIDKEKLEEFNVEITERIASLERNIYTLAEEEFNINSTQQLGKILFEKLKIPVGRKTKTGYSTDKEVLEQIEEGHEIVTYILEYRTLAKLKSTYVDGLKPLIKEDGRLHTTYMQSLTQTGRLSSVEPNLQNIPARGEVGKNIRKFFVAEKDNYILDADYSQIELRVLSHMANDDTMINAFNNNIDVHSVTASQVFNVPLEEVTSTLRSRAKAVNFGIVYGISQYGLAKNIGVSNKEAKEYIDNYLEKYHSIREYMDNAVKDAEKAGYSITLFGRRRKIPELTASNKNIKQFGQRIAMNSPIQGTAADIIKLAMVNIFKRFKEENLKSKMLLQVHDELLFEVVKEELEIVEKIVKYEMENVIKMQVTLIAEPSVAKSWYDAK